MSLSHSVLTNETKKSDELLRSTSTAEEVFEEEDESEVVIKESHKIIWKNIIAESKHKRGLLEVYLHNKNKESTVPENPSVTFLQVEIFPLLLRCLHDTIVKAKELECIKHQKSTFNGIDYISEMLWNLNPKHMERWDNWVYRFDMEWVIEWLKENPRPYFPFSWVWSKDFAATKIQAAMRGHWVRRTDEVQELRQFWKALKREKIEAEQQDDIDKSMVTV